MLEISLFVSIVMVLALAVYTRLLLLKIKELKQNKADLITEKKELNTQLHANELKEIRYKLNPHLFKNALNSIQSHAYQTYYSMDKLSGVLDYVLYESDQPLVPLTEELEFALNFIEINRLKLSPLYDLRVRNTIDLEQITNNGLKTLPLITVDLIENAFKHTDFQKSDSFISIHLALKDNYFTLEVSNRISEVAPLKKQRSGIGLKNLKDRLVIAYPDAHEIMYSKEDSVFHARLNIKLNDE